MSEDKNRVRALNDDFRSALVVGSAIITTGIAALGGEKVERLVRVIATFNEFCSEDDPYGEHDFGAFDFDGTKVMFKINYLNKEIESDFGNPADSSQAERVITVMLAEEY